VPTTRVNALSLGVFANLFKSVAEQMGVTLQHASFSQNIKMRRDYSCAIFDASGRMLAQAAHMPVHLGAMPLAMQAVRNRYELGPGDVAILNDPYEGGTHLPDLSLVSAAFAENGMRLGYVMSRAHHADVGGMSPGSMPLSTEIYQEGIIIPPLLLRANGAMNEILLELFLRNVRTPEERRGDLQAQLAAQSVGEAGLTTLTQQYGWETVGEHGEALQQYSEAAMRALIRSIPPGEYQFVDYLDDDGQSDSPVEIRVNVRRSADSDGLEIDFTGSAPQCRGPVNAVRAVTVSAALYVMRCVHGADVPVNAGSLAPLRIVTPEASVVAASAPAPVAGGNVETSQRIVDVLFGALAQALPGRCPAASQGTMNNIAMGGFDHCRNRQFAYYETMGGGMGARPASAGMSGLHDHMSNTLNTPIEEFESEYPLRVSRYMIRRGTGGSGRFNGGDGLQRDLLFLEDATVTLLTERRRRSPYGLEGGSDAATGQNVLQADHEYELPAKALIQVRAGQTVSIRTPGGGGLGHLPIPSEG
jgi:N-methylhydantoinase B